MKECPECGSRQHTSGASECPIGLDGTPENVPLAGECTHAFMAVGFDTKHERIMTMCLECGDGAILSRANSHAPISVVEPERDKGKWA